MKIPQSVFLCLSLARQSIVDIERRSMLQEKADIIYNVSAIPVSLLLEYLMGF